MKITSHCNEEDTKYMMSSPRFHPFSSSKTIKTINGSTSTEYSSNIINSSSQTYNNMLHGNSFLSLREVHAIGNEAAAMKKDTSGRERLTKHREEVAGRVLIPDKWGQEEMLKDWIDCSAFDALLVPNRIASARKALVAADGHSRSTSSTSHQQKLRIESRCC